MELETARDLAVVVLAITSAVWLLILCAVGIVVLRLLLAVAGKAPQALDTVVSTTRTVRGTTESVELAVARPLVRLAALYAGVRRFVEVLLRP